MILTLLKYCNCETKLLKLKANYNYRSLCEEDGRNCNCETKLLKLKANYNE